MLCVSHKMAPEAFLLLLMGILKGVLLLLVLV